MPLWVTSLAPCEYPAQLACSRPAVNWGPSYTMQQWIQGFLEILREVVLGPYFYCNLRPC